MTKFKKVIATAEAKVAKAEAEAFAARLEAIEAILQNASEYDVLTLCARVLATVVPDCCDKHQEEFKGELLRVLSDCVEIVRQERNAAEAAENRDSEEHPPVH